MMDAASLQVIAFEVREATLAGVLVWDLDLHHPHLPFPCTLQQYADYALQAGAVQLPQQFQRWVPGLYCQDCTAYGTRIVLPEVQG